MPKTQKWYDTLNIEGEKYVTYNFIRFSTCCSMVVLLCICITYQKKNKVKEALASIDVQLKKRYDLIPNVLFIANKFMEHERSLIEDITRLRTEALKLQGEDTISQKMQLDKDIQSKMSQLMVSVENYPQLKSDNTMVQAMETYSEVEEHIAASRRFYNASVLDLKMQLRFGLVQC